MSAQVEETSREREERLKGWSTFLDAGQQKNDTSKAAESGAATEPSEPSGTTQPEQQPQTEPQPSEQREPEADSTDSSLAGSDDDEKAETLKP